MLQQKTSLTIIKTSMQHRNQHIQAALINSFEN